MVPFTNLAVRSSRRFREIVGFNELSTEAGATLGAEDMVDGYFLKKPKRNSNGLIRTSSE